MEQPCIKLSCVGSNEDSSFGKNAK
uniref:Uncharacterized protein n=1 Tax=Anguilla anguilla TaxID=7936 RepID=A0A0E9PMT4_ANGAN